MVFAHPKYSAMGREEERKKEFLAIGPLFDVKPDECPCCHGRHIVRYGHASSNGRGRYLCKDCHKTFCGSAGTLYYRVRIGQHGIVSFAGSLVLNRTVRDSAKAAGVSKNTERRYRRILLLRLRKRQKKAFPFGTFRPDRRDLPHFVRKGPGKEEAPRNILPEGSHSYRDGRNRESGFEGHRLRASKPNKAEKGVGRNNRQGQHGHPCLSARL